MAKAELITGKEFKPVKITVTLESQKELDLFASIFNYSPIADIILPVSDDEWWCQKIKETAVRAGGDAARFTHMIKQKSTENII